MHKLSSNLILLFLLPGDYIYLYYGHSAILTKEKDALKKILSKRLRAIMKINRSRLQCEEQKMAIFIATPS